MNLITNASDALGDPDGEIRVITRHLTLRSELTAVSGTLPEGDYLTLEVFDTGCGISRKRNLRYSIRSSPPKPLATALGFSGLG